MTGVFAERSELAQWLAAGFHLTKSAVDLAPINVAKRFTDALLQLGSTDGQSAESPR